MSGSFVHTLATTLSTEWEYGVLYIAAATIVSGVVLNFVSSRTDQAGIGQLSMSPEASFATRIFGFLTVLFAASPLVFVPAMMYRSTHEERLLVEAFDTDYRRYQQVVPMLLPRLPIPHWVSYSGFPRWPRS